MICPTGVVSTGYPTLHQLMLIHVKSAWKLWLIWRSFFTLMWLIQKEKRIPFSREKLVQRIRLKEGGTKSELGGFSPIIRREMANTAFKLNLLIGELRGLMKISKRKYQSITGELNSLEHAYLKWEPGSRLKTQQIFLIRSIGWSRNRLNSRFRGKEKFYCSSSLWSSKFWSRWH